MNGREFPLYVSFEIFLYVGTGVPMVYSWRVRVSLAKTGNREVALIRIRPVILVVAFLLSGWVFAHAKIVTTLPADGDFVAAPDSLTLTFDSPVTLTAVELHTVEGDSRNVGGIPDDRAASFTVAVPEMLPPGEYYVVWKSIAADSHFSTGEFFFTVIKN